MVIPVHRSFRTVGTRARDLWPPERRKRYLMAANCRLPISIDLRVTPEATAQDPEIDLIELMAAAHVTPATIGIGARWSGFFEAALIGTPAERSGWLSLGFDVCDEAFCSGLMNCHVTGQEPSSLGAYWPFSLNECHLFKRSSDADSFRQVMDERAPEHAPFAVVRLFIARPRR
jgi:hypothetical protein